MARAHGSYPWCQGFDSLLRYQFFIQRLCYLKIKLPLALSYGHIGS